MFLYAALNDLDIMAGDVTAAFLNAPVGEKVYFRCRPEFGSLQGHLAILTNASYGLKTSARAWRLNLSEVLENQLGYKSCLVDPDIWLRETGKENHKHYKMLLVYTDDILVISHRAKEAMSQLDQHFLAKKDSIGHPTTYLGAQVGKYTFPDEPEHKYWSLGSEKYVKNVVRQAKEWLAKRGQTLKSKVTPVLPLGYRPELDDIPLHRKCLEWVLPWLPASLQ